MMVDHKTGRVDKPRPRVKLTQLFLQNLIADCGILEFYKKIFFI
jgi:hypothetical protein